jgi:hypothetical protein
MTMLTLMARWMLAGVFLWVKYFFRVTRWVRSLAESFPDSGYTRLGENGNFVWPWDVNRERKALLQTMADRMPAEVAQAHADMVDVFRSCAVVAFGGPAILVGVLLSGNRRTTEDTGIDLILLILMLAALMVITALTITRAIRVPWPARWLSSLEPCSGRSARPQDPTPP